MSEDFPDGLTAHAAKVIAERDILLAWIARVLGRPEKTEPDRDALMLRRALARIPEHEGRVLRVIDSKSIKPG
jgi:hypothetical protein